MLITIGILCGIGVYLAGKPNEAPTTHEKTAPKDASAEWSLVIVGVVTAVVIGYQAYETRRATKAMQRSTEATVKSVRLQETALRQWVDIEKWRAMPYLREDGVLTLHIEFDVVNPTNLPLTLNAVSTIIDGQQGSISQKNLLPPKNRHAVAMPIKITQEQLLKWKQDKIGFPVSGQVIYEDILEQVRPQPFGGMIACSEKNGVVFMRFHGPGLYLADAEKDNTNPN